MTEAVPAVAEEISAEVVIIGAGVVGALAAYVLKTRHNYDVALIDAGPRIDRVQALERLRASQKKGTNAPYENPWYAPYPNEGAVSNYYLQEGPKKFTFNGLFLRGVGGSSWHWTGHAERHYPNDFRMRSEYGVGVDWPMEYSEIVPYYEEVEREWGVAGSLADYIGPDRYGKEYPLPPVPMSYSDIQIGNAAATVDFSYQSKGLHFGPTRLAYGPYPHSRNSIPHDGRPQCCGNASCRFLCPIAAKYDASIHVTKAEQAGVRILDQRVVYRVDVGADNQVSGVRYLRPDRSEGRAVGRRYILAAHAIETPKLLLISRSERTPRGVANSSGMVGRNLIGTVDVNTQGLAPKPLYPYRGPVSATGGLKSLRDGPFRATHGAIATNFVNGAWDATLGPATYAKDLIDGNLSGPPLFGTALADKLKHDVARQLMLGSMIDVLPDPDNRIVPDESHADALGIPRPRISFRWDDYTERGVEVAHKMHQAVLDALGVPRKDQKPQKVEVETAIIVGTTVMGRDPRTSVVDSYCRSHDHRNLYVIGTGAYPTTGIVSPSLTAAALALRAVKQIHDEIPKG